MTDFRTELREQLAAASGRGVARASLIPHLGADSQTVWIPESADEPVFLAYSITKIFIAVLALKLCEEQRLSLDAPLARWFPCISGTTGISIRRLLNHTAGIPDYGGMRAYHDAVRSTPQTPWSFEQFAAATFDKGPSI